MSDPASPRIFVSAGEPSGDRHAAAVASALRRRFPAVRLEALGGRALAEAGADVQYPMSEYTAFGLVEILGKIPIHIRLLRALRRSFRDGRYDLVVLVDYPGFNLRVAEAARRHGVPVLYYIAPQLWAWRPQRAVRFARAIDRLAVILPFETDFFASVGLPAEYVGHPLAEGPPPPSREQARTRLGIGSAERVLAILPGSRRQEVARLWPRFRAAGQALVAEGTCDRVLVAGGTGHGLPEPGIIEVYQGPATDILAAADAALAKSGTTTLEAAMTDTPMVVAYRVHPLTSFLVRRMLRVPWVSLVNLVARERVVPELMQEAVTPERLAREVRPLLDASSPDARAQRDGLRLVRERLAGDGAAHRVADLAADLLAR